MKDDIVKRIMIAGALLIASVVFAVISWMILPDMVATQFKGLQTGAVALPKFLAVFIAFAFSAGFSIVSVKQEEGVKYSLIGFGLHILFWISNL